MFIILVSSYIWFSNVDVMLIDFNMLNNLFCDLNYMFNFVDFLLYKNLKLFCFNLNLEVNFLRLLINVFESDLFVVYKFILLFNLINLELIFLISFFLLLSCLRV